MGPTYQREGEGVVGWADCWAGKGRKGRFSFFFILVIYLFIEIE